MFITKSEELLIRELSKLGYRYKHIDDIYKQKSLPPAVVAVILKWFERVYEEHLGSGDQLVRSLISSAEPFDPTVLIDFFEKNKYNKSIMWGVGYVIAVAKTFEISKWLREQIKNEHPTFEREALVYGLPEKGNFSSITDLKSFLQDIFPKYPLAVLELYKKIGKKDDVIFFESQKGLCTPDVNKEIDKLIKRLTKKAK
jgi:hypothetical protein